MRGQTTLEAWQQALLVWSGQHQVRARMRRLQLDEGLGEQIESLDAMDPPEEQDHERVGRNPEARTRSARRAFNLANIDAIGDDGNRRSEGEVRECASFLIRRCVKQGRALQVPAVQ